MGTAFEHSGVVLLEVIASGGLRPLDVLILSVQSVAEQSEHIFTWECTMQSKP